MNLHRTGKTPEWRATPIAEHTIWQRIANQSRGVVTPANLISLSGLALTMSGLQDFNKGNLNRASSKIILGRVCDIADGYVADRTKTKSPIGEAVDATVDKISMAHGLYVLSKTNTLPVLVTASFLTQNVINTAATVVAKKRGVELHPSAEGKITTLLQWASIGGYVLNATLGHNQEEQATPSSIALSSHAIAAGATMLGSYVNKQYVQTVFKQSIVES